MTTSDLLVPPRVFEAFVNGCPLARSAILAELNAGVVVAMALDHLADDHADDDHDGPPVPVKRPA